METIPHITLEGYDARQRIAAGIKYHMKDRAKWLPAYDKVSQWFADNNSRGLICTGTCGLGKSLICRDILPQLYRAHFNGRIETLAISATDMNRRIDELLKFCDSNGCPAHHVIIVDDLGTEAVETFNYGNRRRPFCELVDRAEQTGTMLIITTNLFTTIPRLKRDCIYGRAGELAPKLHESIEQRYGVRTLDRLRATTRVILFEGASMRGS